jgi:pimeloyl-ACP methyl ester carboxylesterase
MQILWVSIKYASTAIGAVGVLILLLVLADLAVVARYRWWRRRCEKLGYRPFGASPLTESADSDVIVTLVHGTWAPDADWTHEHSTLRETLVQQLKGHRVSFHALAWSGGSSSRARAEAATQLIEDLRALASRYTGAKLVVVAHSHGGNALMYALRKDPTIRTRLAGIVCIATPFLHVRLRDLHPFDDRFVRGMLAGLIAIPLGLAVHHFVAGKPPLVEGAVTITALIACTLGGWGLGRLNEEFAAHYCRIHSLPHGELPPMLLMRAVADEAAAILALVTAGCMLSTMVWHQIAGLGGGLAQWAQRFGVWTKAHWRRVLVMLAILASLVAAYGWTDAGVEVAILVLAAAMVLALLLIVVLRALPGLLSIVALMVVAVGLLPYVVILSLLSASVSPGFALAGLYLEVVAEALPLGPHGLTLYAPEVPRHAGASIEERVQIPMHSRLHSDLDACLDIARWVRARIEA